MPLMLRRPLPIGLGDDQDPDALAPIGQPEVQEQPPQMGTAAPMVAPPPIGAPSPIAAPAAKAPIGNPKLAADESEYERIKKSGSGISQILHPVDAQGNPDTTKKPGFWKKLGSVAAHVGDIAGTAFFPGITAQIPGTQLHHDILENQAQGRVTSDLAQEKEQKSIDAMDAPKPKEEHWSVSPDFTGPKGEPVLVEQNSGQMKLQDSPTATGIKLKTPAPKTDTVQQGYAGAISDAISRGVDPVTDPHVMAWKTANDNIAKQQKPDSPEQQYIDEYQQRNKGATVADAIKAYSKDTVKPPVVNVNAENKANDARMDKSYQFNAGALTKIADPIEQQASRMGRLAQTLEQSTPQADALVAPELLTVMAGGMGSGLRMNEAEISRIVGGRSNFESLKASLNKWQIDPSKALTITSAQREQVRALMTEVSNRLVQKREVVENAHQQLIDATDVKQHRKIVADARKALADIDAGKSEGGGGGVEEYVRDPVTKKLVKKTGNK